jgi:hypothetical protein
MAAAAAAVLVGAAAPFLSTPESSVAALCVALLGGGGMYALSTADMAVRVPPGLVSAAGGVCAAAQSVAQIAANFAIGFSVTRTQSYTYILVALAAWVIPGTAIWLSLRPPPPHAEEPLTASGSRRTASGSRRTASGSRRTASGSRRTAPGSRRTASGSRR